MNTTTFKSQIAFWFHLFVTLLAWVAPFLFSWKWSIPVYAAVMIQFAFFGRCLMNEQHEMTEDDNATFYSYLFEKIGFQPDRARLKFYVRKVFYPVLSAVALFWQVVLGIAPVLF
ncbi:MAG: hypothetical protein KDC61_11485 [Saprospiraceae bacterium]|nr:hypothetical protein [Saprospiraceae bacterium]MCB0543608.1 hypothetical protein [Saprospiraceae bacterium]MCB0575173.1 hypothetical protein [Saprospiraceae bacterium]MCB9305548.1 hypothetical protein [Lewinellaceae bacterium]MCB9355056.1 hypothetical protein [Lewinellaceae bacterium]